MLNEAGNAVTLEHLDGSVASRAPDSRAHLTLVPQDAPAATGGRYGEGRRFNSSALGVTIAVHAVVLLALLGLGVHAAKKQELRLVSVNLNAPPPAPPPPSPDKTKSQKLAVTIQQQPVPTPVTPQPMIAIAPPAPAPAPVAAPVADTPAPAPPAPPAPPTMISSNSLGTRMISGNPPSYPLDSRRKREQGKVELLIILGVNGAVETISVSHSSGFPRLDSAALSAVRRWRWSPTLHDGVPVKVRGIVEIPFVIAEPA